MSNTILDKYKEKHNNVAGIDAANNLSEAIAIVNGKPEMAGEAIVTVLEAAGTDAEHEK